VTIVSRFVGAFSRAQSFVYRRVMNRALLRLGLLAAVALAFVALRYQTRFGAELTTDSIRAHVQHAGALGLVLYALAFAVGELLHVPGLVFVAAAVTAWGHAAGGLAAYVGALGSVSVSFVVVRAIGGQPLATVERAWMKRALAALERRPVVVVAGLRLVLFMAPTANYALALSPVRYRDYLIGSALGLALPIALTATLFGIWLH
jgi:uncharacterized membrane protein YdjX (TVP38/TMEM64 family)